ncbi:MAG: glycoside hydrolase family 9 protein [Eubacteriales bacterium]
MTKKKGLIFILLVLFALSSMLSACDRSPAPSPTQQTDTPAPPTATPEPTATPDPDEGKMIKNGDFSREYEFWGMFLMGPTVSFEPSEGTAKIPINKTGSEMHSIQVFQDGILLVKDCQYRVQFDVKSTVPRHIQVRVQKNGSPYTGYMEEIIPITSEFETYTLDFTMEYDADPTCRIVFNIGKFVEDDSLPAHTIEIDNVSLEMVGGDASGYVFGEEKTSNIRINQLGYKLDSNKIAAFVDIDDSVSEFTVADADGNAAFTGNIGAAGDNPNSGEKVRLGDFTALNEPGVYHIEIEGYENSYEFEIADNIYEGLLASTLKMFYYQRCGMDLTEKYAEDWAHDACHTKESRIYMDSKTVDMTGGWHDAGDFGKYVTPASKAVIDLLLAYEANPDAFSASSNIPESNDSIPDVLDEVKYELDFLLKMQNAETGGVHHKLTAANFADVLMPNESNAQLIINPISGMATADFAAVMAKVSSMALPFGDEYSQECLASAELAWQWLEANPDAQSFKNPQGIVTGEYGDSSSMDERFWAAAELYKATGDEKYHTYLKDAAIYSGMGWQEIGMYGVISYLSLPTDMQDAELYEKMLSSLLSAADTIIANSKQDMYQLSLTYDDYVWGSNMLVADNAMLLLIANEYKPDEEYVSVAYEHLNYLLGKNAMDKSYITGFGTNQVHNIHHRVTQTVGEVFPGLVIGGPNKNLEDPYALTMLEGKPPAKCYADSEQSYSTNEITIYWNSPVVYLLSYFQ